MEGVRRTIIFKVYILQDLCLSKETDTGPYPHSCPHRNCTSVSNSFSLPKNLQFNRKGKVSLLTIRILNKLVQKRGIHCVGRYILQEEFMVSPQGR